MKSNVLKPTQENLLKAYLDDSIGRDSDIISFIQILNCVEDSYSIAIDGKWGSGKTFFAKQVKLVLDAYSKQKMDLNEKEQIIQKTNDVRSNYICSENISFIPQVCVYYDAWINDNDDDPILSLVYSIASQMKERFDDQQRSDIWEKTAAVLEVFTGRNWSQLAASFKKKNLLESLKDQESIDEKINDFLEGLLSENGNRLVVFIDELDRCRPPYAIKLLERIKHYFENPNVTFVFSVNLLELQHTLKNYYGVDFDASRYLDRFFDLRVSLPSIDYEMWYRKIGFDQKETPYDHICAEIIEKNKLTMREAARYLQAAKFAINRTIRHSEFWAIDNNPIMSFLVWYFIPIMIELKLFNSDEYEKFIAGTNPSYATEIAKNVNVRIFSELYSASESYTEKTKKTFVPLEEKIQTVYEAVFQKELHYDTVQIGKGYVDDRSKTTLMKIMTLLSTYAERPI